LIEGYFNSQQNSFVSGFFDKGSFTETLVGWGKTVVCGRARLGGIPMGVIAVETRTVEQVIPADPADMNSKEQRVQQAGGVWYPDSAFKTAQTIMDLNREQLPLMIFANWRGFSGGLRDLFDEVLKFGSLIVDALREYEQPIFVYIPPNGELRGGAWVVVDPTINPQYMEMYCDTNSRGGVLEATGTVEIKFKEKDILDCIQRNGHTKDKYNIFQQVAINFADLHDTPGRMKAKGCVKEIVSWDTARQFFYNRLNIRLSEMKAIKLEALKKKKLEIEMQIKNLEMS